MGASQSTGGNAEGAATTIFIQENEIPEAYRRVGVSDEVVEAVARTAPRGTKIVFEADGSPSKLSNDLLKERQENQRLREELKRPLGAAGVAAASPAPDPRAAAAAAPWQAPPQQAPQHAPKKAEISREDMEEKKRVFEETVNRVKKEFFGYQRENVCGDVEKVRSFDCFFPSRPN
ncbi:CBN-CHCH-3 protein [Aphelenchoides fujianensis]|nr:CBN-CHCH-3 protein [Aphelenchoides fujianensis]